LIEHIQYSDWPDKDVPRDYESILFLLKMLENCTQAIFHCSAGIGRSGAIVCVIECFHDFKSNGEASVFKIARRLREQRYGAIQNLQQYQFIYDFLRHAIQNSYL
jgi:protein tyrosine phosphatase